MTWAVRDDLDKLIIIARDDWEKHSGKTISKKNFIKKLMYENQNIRKVLENCSIGITKEIDNLPKL